MSKKSVIPFKGDDGLEALLRPPESLDKFLQSLCKYGQPTIRRMNRGWFAKIQMNTNCEGAKFDIDSEFDHATPSEAVAVLAERIHKALKKINSAVAE